MISRSLILQILQAAKIMRRFFYEAPAEIMRIYTTFLDLKKDSGRGSEGWILHKAIRADRNWKDKMAKFHSPETLL